MITNNTHNGEGKTVIQVDKNGEIIRRYNSISEASRVVGVDTKGIRNAANGLQKTAGGFYWIFD